MVEQVAAIIPAAGLAKRFGSGENKIWSLVGGRSVLERTLAAFQEHPEISSVVVVTGESEIGRVREAVRSFSKVTSVVEGGETRALSVQNGLSALPLDTTIVLVHDAARPLLFGALISRVIAGVKEKGAAIPGTSLPDTVKRVDEKGRIRATVSRSLQVDGETLSGLTSVQTPQGARLSLLKSAYATFDFLSAEPTDEASLLEAAGIPVFVVLGDSDNLKITLREDVERAEQILSKRESIKEMSSSSSTDTNTDKSNPPFFPEIRTGFGYDVHTFALPDAGRKLFLGGVEIPHDRGLEGHSDADVILHAVCDALLGAIALGDIGILFPNTDPAYKGISSLKLLAVVAQRVRQEGWSVINIDVTAVAEAPKMMPYSVQMREAMASELEIEVGRVSVKATTSEGMGFVGRKEGICAWAVATLMRR